MLLTVDIGNTNITFGLYEGATLGPRWRIRTIHDKMPDEYGILLDQLFRHQGYRPDQVAGVAIAPGIGIAAQALFVGYVGLVEGMVARFKAELGPETRVVATGGLVETIARETEVIDVVDPWLTLHGLRIIYELNR